MKINKQIINDFEFYYSTTNIVISKYLISFENFKNDVNKVKGIDIHGYCSLESRHEELKLLFMMNFNSNVKWMSQAHKNIHILKKSK
jgi:hypothetical protein